MLELLRAPELDGRDQNWWSEAHSRGRPAESRRFVACDFAVGAKGMVAGSAFARVTWTEIALQTTRMPLFPPAPGGRSGVFVVEAAAPRRSCQRPVRFLPSIGLGAADPGPRNDVEYIPRPEEPSPPAPSATAGHYEYIRGPSPPAPTPRRTRLLLPPRRWARNRRPSSSRALRMLSKDRGGADDGAPAPPPPPSGGALGLSCSAAPAAAASTATVTALPFSVRSVERASQPSVISAE